MRRTVISAKLSYFYGTIELKMRHSQKFLLLIVLLLIALSVNLMFGSVILPLKTWTHLLTGQAIESGTSHIISYRLMKAITAVIVGSSLALSGLFMQSIFRNPIVGPYVLGTSSAAGLGVAILLLGGAIAGFNSPDIGIATAAIAGSILSLLLIILLYHRLKSAVNLLIAGLMLGIFSGAVINLLSYFTQANALQKFVFWSMGNLGNLSWTNILLMSLVSIVIFALSIFYIKKLNVLLIGENYAKSMGINVYRTHLVILIFTGILVGVVTAMVGPIAFVGLAVPHLARLYFKTALHQILMPGVLLIGSITMLLCDSIAQVPDSSLSLPINSITALFGAPLVVYLIMKRN